jgi:hypothetical protein
MISFARLLRVLLLGLFVCGLLGALSADVKVKGYTRKDGTYVAPHTRSSPNKTKNDNYSTRGNINPYTGQAGTKPGEGPAATSTEPAPQKTEAAVQPSFFSQVSAGMSPAQVTALAGEPQMVRGTTWIYREGRVDFSANSVVSRVTANTAPASSGLSEITPSRMTAPVAQEKSFWITNSSGIRHNSRCRYFQNSKGHAGTQNEGRACKICGG